MNRRKENVLYFVSKENLHNQVVTPNDDKRIIVTPLIDLALFSLGDNLENKILYVHELVDYKNIKIISNDVLIEKYNTSDVCNNFEYWITTPVEFKCIYKIKIGPKFKFHEEDHQHDYEDMRMNYWQWDIVK